MEYLDRFEGLPHTEILYRYTEYSLIRFLVNEDKHTVANDAIVPNKKRRVHLFVTE